MRKSKIISLLVFLAGAFLIVYGLYRNGDVLFSPLSSQIENAVRPYEKYTFENLANREVPGSIIEVRDDKFFYHSEGRAISGAVKFPSEFSDKVKYPVVVMARGYVEKEGYQTGTGTKNAAAVYAKSGFITLAPDFSGYGESDSEDSNALGARLSKPVEILDLLASLKYLPYVDLSRVYLWGHSNGGQIMLSVAEILGRQEQLNPPTLKASEGRGKNEEYRVRGVTLWAPVSKPFPYNILYYTDEASDSGKWLRKEVSKFEEDYDVFNYSIDRYLDWINLPVQIHQGTQDEAVPKKWSDELVKNLKDKDKEVNYYVYPGADHNMKLQPTAKQSGGQAGWDNVVSRDVEWFQSLK